MDTYLHLLPNDLLSSLLLYFESFELYAVLNELTKIQYFDTKFHNSTFKHTLKMLYQQHISSITPPPESFTFEDYMAILDRVNSLSDYRNKIYFLAKEGYEVLLYPLLKTTEDYNAAFIAATIGKHYELMEILKILDATVYKQIKMETLPMAEDMIFDGIVTYETYVFAGTKAVVDLIIKYSGKGPKPKPITRPPPHLDFDADEEFNFN